MENQLPTLKKALSLKYNVPITSSRIAQLVKMCSVFEVKKEHPLALNTGLLGVNRMYFLPTEYNMIFDIFDINIEEFRQTIYTTEYLIYLRKKVKDPTNSVFCDAYNILTIWLCHCGYKSSVSSKEKEIFIFTLLKMLNYKFFTSCVNYMFPYTPQQTVMEQTIDELSYKFDIKNPRTPTWKAVLENRCKELMKIDSIHYKTLINFTSDKKVVYVITDINTRMRLQIRKIVREFYRVRDEKQQFRQEDLVGNIAGEKVIKELTSSFDNIILNVASSALNMNQFIDHEMIQLVVGLNKNINPTILRTLLTHFSDLAILQYKNQTQNEILKKNNITYLKGYKVLISYIVQKTLRFCMLDKTVNFKSKLAILKKTSDIYKSSRILNEDLLSIKDSVGIFIDKNIKVKRESTKATLRIAFIQYIILQSFKFL